MIETLVNTVPQTPKAYPYVGFSGRDAVLFYAPGRGVLLDSVDRKADIGLPGIRWTEQMFRPLKAGEYIQISNVRE